MGAYFSRALFFVNLSRLHHVHRPVGNYPTANVRALRTTGHHALEPDQRLGSDGDGRGHIAVGQRNTVAQRQCQSGQKQASGK